MAPSRRTLKSQAALETLELHPHQFSPYGVARPGSATTWTPLAPASLASELVAEAGANPFSHDHHAPGTRLK